MRYPKRGPSHMKKLLVLLSFLLSCEQEPRKNTYTYVIGDIPVRCYQKKGTESCFCCHAELASCRNVKTASFQFVDCYAPRQWNIQLLESP